MQWKTCAVFPGYYGPAHLVLPNYLTPWQPQALIYSLQPMPAWVQPSIPQSLGAYGPVATASTSGAPPQVMQSFKLVGPASECCLFWPAACGVETETAEPAAPRQQAPQARGGPEARMGECGLSRQCDRRGRVAHRLRAEPGRARARARAAPKQRGRTRKRERPPRVRKKRKTKAEAGKRVGAKRKLGVQEDDRRWSRSAQTATPKSCLHERMAQSVRVFHRLGDKAADLSPFWVRDRATSAATQGVTGKREGELRLSGRGIEETVHGGTPQPLVPGRGSGNVPASSAPQTPQAETPCGCAPAPCSQPAVRPSQGPKLPHGPPRGPEKSTPILPWQRERREAMKKEAQKQREQAARVTRMGLDYTSKQEKYTLESSLLHLGLDSPISKPLLFQSLVE
ncbi:hypothetical protein AAFF_G00103560 [Aldrovandia affinis]|uniref:DUF4629 domain-containing protein n=1 Tax=Aldrovandia affinis TaxID=143900 RepID=A0AAD7RU33_9TELE|nr:hypothetical protein AAFF_G00103560 [Aldrovandia affinis]